MPVPVLDRRRTPLVLRLLLVVGALALGTGGAPPAAAHATLAATVPVDDQVVDTAPEALELRFTEAVEVDDAGIEVYGPDGAEVEVQVPDGDASRTVRAPVELRRPGTHTVAWNVVSADGHAISGSFVFSVEVRTGAAADVGQDDPAPALLGAVGRWLAFGGALVAGGALAFWFLVLRGEAPSRLRLALLLAAAVAVAGSAADLLASVAEGTGSGLVEAIGRVSGTVAGSRYAAVGAARVGAAALLLVAVAAAVTRPGVGRRPWLAVPPALALLLVPSLAGHAWTTSPRAVAVATEAVHSVAVSVWVGGLVALAVVARGASGDQLGRSARRFSVVALWAVGAVVATGTVSALLQVRTLDGLFGTGYGRLLLAKVAGVALLVALGWLNRARLLPALDRGSALLRSVRVEVGVATLVVALTAVLVEQVPAREDRSQPFAATSHLTEGAVALTLAPAEVGANELVIEFLDHFDRPRPVDAIELTAEVGTVPARRLDTEVVTASEYAVADAAFGAPGDWRITVTSVYRGRSSTTTFEVPIR